jgi:translocation and assembly module TamB
MKVTVLPSQVGATKVTSGEFSGALRDGRLKLDKGELLAEDTTVRVMGEIGGLQGTPSSALTYELQAQNVTPWLALAGLNATGAVTVNGTAQGALSAIATKGTVAVINFAMNDNRVGRGTVAYALSNIGSQQPQGQVTVDGQNIEGGTRLRSVHADVAFSGLQPVQVQADLRVEDVESRAHHMNVRAQYTPDRTEAVIRDIAVQLPSGVWKNPQDTHVVFTQGKLSIDKLALQHAGQSLRVSGTAAQHGPLDLTVQVDQFSLEEVNAFLTDPLPASTIVNADVRIQGTTQQPDATATITTGELKVAGQSYAGLEVKSALRNERLGLNLLLRQDEQHTLRVDGGVPVSLRSGTPVLGDVDLRIQSDGLSLAFVELLNRDIQEVKGALTVDVAVRGPVAQLTPSGTIQLQEASARVKPLGVRFSQIGIGVQLSANQVTLRQLVVHSDEGQLSGRGTIGLAGYEVKSTDVSITADRFRVIDTKEYRAALSGRLGVSGSLQQLLVRGDLTVVDATAHPNLALMKSGPAAPDPTIVVVRHSNDVAVATKQQDEGEREEPGENSDATNQSGVYQQLAMNIDVTIPHDTWVHMREGSIELRGDLGVRKASGEEPNVSGVIETVRGWYAFHGRKFRLEQGKVVLTGETPPNPSLDVVARYTLPDYKVDVVVGGTVKEPTVTFRSEPSLEQADILSLLMFGKPANALTNVEKSSLQSQAVAAATGAVAEELRSALSQTLAVDNLELDMGESPSQAKVGVGKYIAPGLYVSTTEQVGGSKQGHEVNIEYQIADNWQLKGSSTSEGNSGIDILWRKQY